MNICRDGKNIKLTLSQANYIEKVLQCVCMESANAVNTPLPNHLKLTKGMCPKTQEEEEKISKVPYASAIGRLMYTDPGGSRRPKIQQSHNLSNLVSLERAQRIEPNAT